MALVIAQDGQILTMRENEHLNRVLEDRRPAGLQLAGQDLVGLDLVGLALAGRDLVGRDLAGRA